MLAPTTTRVLAFAGSLRRHSHNNLLIEAATALAPDGMTIDSYRDLGSLPLFDEDAEHDRPANDAVRHFRHAVASADGLLIATPEYNRSYSGVLKNAIDWLSRDDDLLWGRPVAVLGATTGPWGTRLAQTALTSVLHATGAAVMPGHDVFVRDAERELDHVECRISERYEERLRTFASAFRDWIACTAPWRARRLGKAA
ncbi:MAG: NADPH-dependent FMN reductase [Deltaproteobacteria bacterium]